MSQSPKTPAEKPAADSPPHNVIERERMPDGQAPQRGEQTGKRTNDERNDPDMQPASRDGMPHAPRGT